MEASRGVQMFSRKHCSELKGTQKLDWSMIKCIFKDTKRGHGLINRTMAMNLFSFQYVDFYKKASTLTYSLFIVVVEGCRIIRILCQPLDLYPLLALSLIFGSDYNIESTHICKFCKCQKTLISILFSL